MHTGPPNINSLVFPKSSFQLIFFSLFTPCSLFSLLSVLSVVVLSVVTAWWWLRVVVVTAWWLVTAWWWLRVVVVTAWWWLVTAWWWLRRGGGWFVVVVSVVVVGYGVTRGGGYGVVVVVTRGGGYGVVVVTAWWWLRRGGGYGETHGVALFSDLFQSLMELSWEAGLGLRCMVFAMPETALGLFPDVGASYFLSRLPGFFGNGSYILDLYSHSLDTRSFLKKGLDGAEISIACGLATHFVPSERLYLLEKALCKVDSSDPAIISAVIDEYSQQPYMTEQSAYHRLDKEGSKVFGQCLVREYRMACNAMQGKVSKDLFEGYRAILLAKNKNPKKWEPSKLELVSDCYGCHILLYDG
uniref:3-hydroxyisobutyryl-CoA hydrolase n=1 Tax=Fagus sylvatica TaxID=28930 RepID=A0A2N9I635_FAGSY